MKDYQQQLHALALSGANNREIAAALGVELTADDMAVIDRARVVARLKRQTKKAEVPLTNAERQAKFKSKRHRIERRQPADMARRTALEADPAAWLKYYLAAHYPRPFGEPHLAIIRSAQTAIMQGASTIAVAPRGTGKTRVLWGMAVWAKFSGHRKMPAFVGYEHRAAREGLRGWAGELSAEGPLRDDYPEYCDPFTGGTHTARLKHLFWGDTGEPCGADMRTMDGMVILPGALGAMCSLSLQGSNRGLHVNLPGGGGVARPDLILLDDPQERERAGDAEYCRGIIEKIHTDLLSMAGPDIRLTCMVAGTIIKAGDVVAQLSDDPEFQAVRVSQITAWPTGWVDKASPVRQMWHEWNRERLDGLQEGDNGDRARQYYATHKAELTAGMAVSWEERYDRKTDPDAYYAAMWDYYRLGEDAFAAERQNAPIAQTASVYDLSAADIVSKASDRAALELPGWAKVTLASTDVNHYGLHSVIVGFGNDQTAAVLWYRRFDRGGEPIVPANAPEQVRRQLIFEALAEHGKELEGLGIRIDAWYIDGGYEMDVVGRFTASAARPNIACCLARGYGGMNYRPQSKGLIGKPREQCHAVQWQTCRGLAWNADYWKELAQRAWLGSVDSPGSISLFRGHHHDFAAQIVREKLLEKLQGKAGPVWRWQALPGWHDYGDALAQCYAGAAFAGIGTMSAGEPVKTSKPGRRKITVSL